MMRHNGPAGNLAPDPVLSNAFTSWGQYIVHDILQTPDAFTNVNDEDKPFDKCKCDASHEEFDNFCYKVDLSQDKENDRNTGWDTEEVPCISIVRSQSRVMPKRADQTDFSFDSLLREQAWLILTVESKQRSAKRDPHPVPRVRHFSIPPQGF